MGSARPVVLNRTAALPSEIATGDTIDPAYLPAGSRRLLYAQTVIQAGDTLALTTTEQAFASRATLPAGLLAAAGMCMTIRGRLTFTTPVVTAPTVTAVVRLGGIAIVTSPPVADPTGATNAGASFEVQATVRGIGAAGVIEAGGSLRFVTTTATGQAAVIEVPSSAKTINLTGVLPLALSAVASATTAGNTITLRQLEVDLSTPPQLTA